MEQPATTILKGTPMTSISTRGALLIIQHSLHIQFVALTNASQCSDRSAVHEPDTH